MSEVNAEAGMYAQFGRRRMTIFTKYAADAADIAYGKCMYGTMDNTHNGTRWTHGIAAAGLKTHCL